MKAEDWMTCTVRTCRPDTSMSEAAQLMWRGDCGVLPVVDSEQHVVGMITDRDLCMGAHFQEKPMCEIRVADSMSHTVFSCHASDPIEQVIRRMADGQVRRIPVLDARDKLVGIISLNDLARRIVGLSERARGRLAPRLIEALASICGARDGAGVPELASMPRQPAQPILVG